MEGKGRKGHFVCVYQDLERWPQWCAIQRAIYFINPVRSLRPQESTLSHVPLTSHSISTALAPSDTHRHAHVCTDALWLCTFVSASHTTVFLYFFPPLTDAHIHTPSPTLSAHPITSISPRGLGALMSPPLPCEISGLPERSPSLIDRESRLLTMSAQG